MSRLRRALSPLAAFFLPVGLFGLICACCGIHPFGDKTLLISDMRNQYVSFLGYMQSMLSEGNNVFYSLSTTLGGNVFGLYTTYLISPVNLLVFLFPRAMLADAVLCLLTVKIGLIGLSSWWCLRQIGSRSPFALVLSTSFALCGYVIGFFCNFMWLEALALAPLVTLGLYRLVTEKKFVLYTASLAAALICNYYTGYMLCVFSVLLFIGFSVLKPVESAKWWGGRCVRFALASLLAAGLAAIVLVPTFSALSGTKSTFNPENFSFTANIYLPNLLLMFMTGSFSHSAPVGYLPFLFCGAGILALALLYFCNRAIPHREKLLAAALLGIFIVSFHVNPLNLVWHAFNPPSSFPYRYSSLCILTLMLLATRCFMHLDGVRPGAVLSVAAALSLGFLFINPPTSGDALTAKVLPEQYLDITLVCVCCALLYVALTRPKAKRIALVCLAVVQLGQVVANGAWIIPMLQSTPPLEAAHFSQDTAESGHMWDALRERDDDLYRVETFGFAGSANQAMMLAYPGIPHFSSVQNTDALRFASSLGYSSNLGSTIYPTTQITDAVDTLLGTRYLVMSRESRFKPYPVVFETGDKKVYENSYALPLAYAASPKVLEGDWPVSEIDPLASTNAIYAAILGQEDLQIFVPLERGDTALTQMAYELDEDIEVYTTKAGDGLPAASFQAATQLDGPVFAALARQTREVVDVEVFSGSDALGSFYSYSRNDTFALGDFGANESAVLKLLFSPDTRLALENVAFYQEDLDAFDQAYADIAEHGATLEKRTSSRYTGQVTLPEDKPLLLTTLPYDPAWRISVDGQSVAPVKALGALMAIEMTPGEHTFTLRYVPRGFAAGATLSLLSLCAFAAYLLLPAIKMRRAQKSAPSA